MSVAQRLSMEAYLDLARADPDGLWELWDGEPREKPGMSVEHSRSLIELVFILRRQIDPTSWEIRVDAPRARWTERHAFIPDVAIVQRVLADEQANQPGRLEVYDVPLPLVVEVWSQSTGAYDLEVKLAAYKARGDAEIWLLHPYERTVTRWIRQADSTYTEETFTGGSIALAAVPGIVIDLDAIFGRSQSR